MDQSAQQALQPVRVLIVEDNAADVVLVSRLLGRCTLFKPVVSVAENLNNALRHLATQPYDIVLLDLNLPDSSDLETLAQVLNQSSELPTPPVVVLTGHGDRETGIRAMQLGAQDFLDKNEMSEALLAKSIMYAIERYQLIASLQQADRLKTQLLSSFSHEMRTPLNAILGFGRSISQLDESAGMRMVREYAKKITESGRQLLLQIDYILKITEIDFSGIAMNEVECRIGSMGSSLLASHRAAAMKKRVSLEFEGDEGTRVWVDQVRLLQVIDLLLERATMLCEEGGRVRLSFTPGGEDTVLFGVEYTGQAITPEHAPSIFEPFYKAGFDKSPFGGSGLELALVRSLLKHMGSVVQFEHTPSGGTFRFALPRTERELSTVSIVREQS